MSKFTCACCGEQAELEVAETEALAEYARVFGDAGKESVAICGVCYTVLMADDPSQALAAMVTEITGQDV